MARVVNAYFIATDDPHFVPGWADVVLLAPDIALSIYDNGMDWVFRSPIDPVDNPDDTVLIDLSTGGRLEIEFMEYNNTDLSHDWLATASFVEVVRALMANKKPSGGQAD